MGFMIRQVSQEATLSEELRLEALERAIPYAEVQAVAAAYQRPGQRRRKLPLAVLLLLVVGMNLYTQVALEGVLARLVRGLRLLWPDPLVVLASKSALCQGRARLGVRPVVALYHRVVRPLARPQTPGAYLWGLHLVGLDGTLEVVPDSPANARAFGRPSNQRGPAAYPQVLGVYLVELGTHAILDAGFWPCRTSEHRGGRRLLRSVGPGMLIFWDSGFHSFEQAQRTRARGAHFVGRLPAHVQVPVATRLPDGSYWSWLRPADPAARAAGLRLRVRVLVYTLTDPQRPGYGQTHRLVTSLLDPQAYLALDLICAYHERWEVEVTLDELANHQRLVQQPLRSQTPLGVLQELYGLLLAHYAVRAVLVDAATTRGLDPDRLSFVRAVRLVSDAIADFQQVVPAQHPALYARLLRDLGRQLLPPRANRSNPRVVKRQQSKFARKRPAHRGLPPLTRTFRQTVQILAPPTPAPLPIAPTGPLREILLI